jgi:rubrerythrin
MSIVESLRKLVDPVEAQRREEELKNERGLPRRAQVGDPPRFVCRICGHVDTQSGYCPTCLADTMERQAKPPADPDDVG